MTDFSKLLAELDATDAMVKAMPAPTDEDERVKAAAKEGGAGGDNPAPEAGGGDPEEDDEDPEMMGKSFSVVLEDGTKVDAYDGTAMMKAFGAKVETIGAVLERSVGLTQQLIEKINERNQVIAGQGALIKALEAKVNAFGNQGRGRVGVVNVHEKPAPETPAATGKGITVGELLVKSQAMFESGKLDGLEFTKIGAALSGGRPLPPSLLEKLTAA